MVFNTATFRKRSLTAILFVVIMLAGIIWNALSFFILFSIIHMGCWIEWKQLIARIDNQYYRITSIHQYALMAAGWVMMLLFFAFIMRNAVVWKQYCIVGFLLLLLLAIVADVWRSVFTWKNFGYSKIGRASCRERV